MKNWRYKNEEKLGPFLSKAAALVGTLALENPGSFV